MNAGYSQQSSGSANLQLNSGTQQKFAVKFRHLGKRREFNCVGNYLVRTLLVRHSMFHCISITQSLTYNTRFFALVLFLLTYYGVLSVSHTIWKSYFSLWISMSYGFTDKLKYYKLDPTVYWRCTVYTFSLIGSDCILMILPMCTKATASTYSGQRANHVVQRANHVVHHSLLSRDAESTSLAGRVLN